MDGPRPELHDGKMNPGRLHICTLHHTASRARRRAGRDPPDGR